MISFFFFLDIYTFISILSIDKNLKVKMKIRSGKRIKTYRHYRSIFLDGPGSDIFISLYIALTIRVYGEIIHELLANGLSTVHANKLSYLWPPVKNFNTDLICSSSDI